jgi:hypothetical protein
VARGEREDAGERKRRELVEGAEVVFVQVRCDEFAARAEDASVYLTCTVQRIAAT